MYQLIYSRSAQKELRHLPKLQLKRILRRIESLPANPRPHGTVAMKGYINLYRLRQGDYRIIYQLNDGKLTILIVEIGSRGQVYRGF